MSTAFTLRMARPPSTRVHSGFGIAVDTRQLSALGRSMRRTAEGRTASRALARDLRVMAESVAADARGRTSYSTRIPASIQVKGGGVSLRVVAGGESAPDAAAIENKGKGFVRHPIFGNRERWTDKNSRPAFLFPALNARREELTKSVEAAVLRAVDRAVVG